LGKKGLAALLCVFLSLLIFARFETEIFVSSVRLLKADALMATLIFAHNSLAATTVSVGMLFLSCLVEALPERFKRREASALKHPRLFSAAFAVLLVLGSLLQFGGLKALDVLPLLMTLPVAAIEVYGLYLAVLCGLRKRVSASNMAKVYTVFLVGAMVETCTIYFVQQLI